MEADAYGGVLIDDRGRVLLREPRRHFGGYVWTYAKGRAGEGETPERAARREVEEETGYRGELIACIPGVFQAEPTATRNVFFLMRPSGEAHAFDPKETQSICWASFAEARELIGQTGYEQGRNRDLAVLEAAERLARRMGLL
jgi:8-oxo-dGTP pyrophosphatase MutT (NUDIX family)